MNAKSEAQLEIIFHLLEEQHRLGRQWPLSPAQVHRDKEVSARLRELIDQPSSREPGGVRHPR